MPPDLEISSDASRLDRDLIGRMLADSYWAAGRPREVVERSIEHSWCFGVYQHGCQIAFARVITDRAVFGYLADVFVVPEHRRRGVAKALIAHILARPELSGLQVLLLRTRDAHGLYAQFGFVPLTRPEEMMGRSTVPPFHSST